MSCHPCEPASRPLPGLNTGRHVPPPVAAAWEAEVARGVGDVLAGAGAPPAAAPPVSNVPSAADASPATGRERLGDYAMLGFAALGAFTLLAVVLRHAHGQAELELVLVAALAAVALVAAHLLMRTRRRSRAAEHSAARAEVELALRARVADSEARQMRLAAFSELAAQIAHEVRNPLSAIVLNAELLEEELHACIHASPEVKRLARAVSAEAERLTELTNEHLTFARLPQPASTPHSLAPPLEEVAHFSRHAAERAGVSLHLDLDPSAAAVVDAKLLRQVLINLLRNGVEAMPGGGWLTLRTSVEGGRVSVDVVDTGPGVPAALQESIFEPFFSTKNHGTGLGLAVARKVARDHGGDLRLLPSAGGAWFRIDLPAAPCPPPEAADTPRAAVPVEA